MCLHRRLFKDNSSNGDSNHGVIIFNRRVLVVVIMPEEVIVRSAGGFGKKYIYLAAIAVRVLETAMLVVLVVLFPASSVAVTFMI